MHCRYKSEVPHGLGAHQHVALFVLYVQFVLSKVEFVMPAAGSANYKIGDPLMMSENSNVCRILCW